jgi:hypothetical protein
MRRTVAEGHESAFTSPRERQLTRCVVPLIRFFDLTRLSLSLLLLTFVFGTENPILSYLLFSQLLVLHLLPL